MSIIVENLEYIYMKDTPYQKKALCGVNLTINDGEILAVTGRTGSGKSTLIQHFNGILKPTAGRVVVNGKDTRTNPVRLLGKEVGLVFQYPEYQLFDETVYKDIEYGLRNLGTDKYEAEKRIMETIEVLGLSRDILGKSPFELSGGQKRRVAIAGVVAMKPSVLVMDEPTAGLDPSGRKEMYNLIRKLHSEENVTVIIVSHSMEEVARLVTRIVVMDEGRIIHQGSPGEVFGRSDILESAGLALPSVTRFMKKVSAVFPGINDSVYTVDQAVEELLKHINREKIK